MISTIVNAGGSNGMTLVVFEVAHGDVGNTAVELPDLVKMDIV